MSLFPCDGLCVVIRLSNPTGACLLLSTEVHMYQFFLPNIFSACNAMQHEAEGKQKEPPVHPTKSNINTRLSLLLLPPTEGSDVHGFPPSNVNQLLLIVGLFRSLN